jgi:phosphoribosyl 1,2-cyclic phosphodiesterase
MKLTFWATRGGIAVPGADTLRYGGNTSCVEVGVGPHRVILDAGTGLRRLGKALIGSGPVDADLLLTHLHLDHVIGLGFFAPLLQAGTRLRIRAGVPAGQLRDALAATLSPPLMPPLLDLARADLAFTGFAPGETFLLRPGLTVATAPLSHPGGATGYRLEADGKSVAYVTDTEHTPGIDDTNVARLARGVDVLIYDSSYTDAELPGRAGWGHSTWQQAVRVADAAGAGRLVLFHHDPDRTDSDLDAIAAAAAARRPGTIAAAEGMELTA